jgi:hypothetical protein
MRQAATRRGGRACLLAGGPGGRRVVLKESGEFLRIRGVHAEDDPRASPRLLNRIAHVAGDWRQRFRRDAVRGAPAVPGALQHCCGALRAGYESWIRHCAILP